MAEIRNGPEEPDRENHRAPTPSDDTGAARDLIEPRSRAEYSADLERHVALVSFEPRRAGLPDVSIKDATEYLDMHLLERPWLSVARGCPPEVQRLFAALDQGRGHAHIRHEGWVKTQYVFSGVSQALSCRVRCEPENFSTFVRLDGGSGVHLTSMLENDLHA